jgi:predicted secreted protein
MSFPDDFHDSNISRFNGKLKIIIIAVVIAVIIFGFFYFVGHYKTLNESTNYLPPNCYSVNGKEICPNP